ncbi:MAG: amidohydrolase family protein [Streptosporangiales bacterium]|nr:amidohydrolase family protein [Streptosporangiales bacterium]
MAVTKGTITALAEPGTVEAPVTLRADGCVVTPGFIDLHSHADFAIEDHPAADSALYQGVTTLLTGNCGFSPFPAPDRTVARRAAGFLDRAGVSWDWTDFDGYARAVQATGPAINIAGQAGHSALRAAAVGLEDRPATPAELDRMRSLLAEAAEQGAHGFSTGLIYAPGAYGDAAEVTALATVAAEHGLLYSTHMRNESGRLLEAVAEALETARRSGVRLEISHLKAMGPANHGLVRDALRMIKEARAGGVDVTADVYPYTASSTTLTSRLPGWAMDGGTPRLLERLADPADRKRIVAEVRERMGRDVDPAGVVIAALPPGPFSGDVAEVLAHPLVSVASDGWTLRPTGEDRPHPRSFGTFVRVLGGYVRKRGLLDLAEAVRKMTSLPASRMGMTDRGVLRPGAVADVAVFDPAAVAEEATFGEPYRLATGVRHVLVGGEAALRAGASTGARNGVVPRAR